VGRRDQSLPSDWFGALELLPAGVIESQEPPLHKQIVQLSEAHARYGYWGIMALLRRKGQRRSDGREQR